VDVSLLITCVVDVVAPDVAEAAVKLLRAAGCEVRVNLDQTCCGQPGWNAGSPRTRRPVARATLDALEADLDAGREAIVVPAGSCATMVRIFWPELFELVGDHEAAARARRVGEHTRELSDFLASRAGELPPLRLGRPVTMALHESCHMLRELRITEAPRAPGRLGGGCEP
jgi:L-lactate dehydrogenase complex protein LldE